MLRRAWSEQARPTFWAWTATLCVAVMLAPLADSKRYLLVGAIGAALVSTTGALLRARRAPLVIVALAELAVAFVWTIDVFARQNAVLGFLPGPDSVSDLVGRWSDYVDIAIRNAAPLPEYGAVTMAMATILVGIGFLVDIVAASLHRAALLGPVFFAAYLTPMSFLGGEISIAAFLVGALGYVFLLAAEQRERLAHWGRQISTVGSLWDHSTEVDEGGLRRSGTRVGLGAIGLAAIVPVVVPTLPPHYFGQSGSGGGGSGDGVVHLGEPVLDLRRNLLGQSDDVLMRVTSTDDPAPEYFQTAVLDEFTGEQWEAGPRSDNNAISTDEALHLPPDLDIAVPRTTTSYDITIADSFHSRWLPVRSIPSRITIDRPWRVDRTQLDVYAGSADGAAGLSYSFTARLVQPTIGQMRSAGPPPSIVEQYAELPGGVPEVFAETARQLTVGMKTNFAKAQAIEGWFRSEFDYSLDPRDVGSDSNIDSLADFLSERIGYCEQYAASMAIMARTLDIPSRVVIGFLQPEPVDNDTWEFRGTDMHAWPELYFAGVGWTRFEPTPNTSDSEGSEPRPFLVSSTTDPVPGNGLLGPGRATQGLGGTDSPAVQPDAGSEDVASSGDSAALWVAPLVLLGVALIVLSPRLIRTGITRRRWSRASDAGRAAEAAWAELRDHVIDLRMDWDSGATPRAIGRSVRERLPDDRGRGGEIVDSLNRLVLAIEQARYAPAIRHPKDLRRAASVVAVALARRQTKGRRLLAWWLPASLLRSRHRIEVRSERIGEFFTSVEH